VAELKVASIVTVPSATAVALPLEPAVLLTVANPVFDELHVTHVVRSCKVPSARVPDAEN
jgi:hypothetical protein